MNTMMLVSLYLRKYILLLNSIVCVENEAVMDKTESQGTMQLSQYF